MTIFTSGYVNMKSTNKNYDLDCFSKDWSISVYENDY